MVCRHSNLTPPPPPMLQLGESSMKPHKTAGPKGTRQSQHNSPSTWAELKNAIANITNMGGTEGTPDQETSKC